MKQRLFQRAFQPIKAIQKLRLYCLKFRTLKTTVSGMIMLFPAVLSR